MTTTVPPNTGDANGSVLEDALSYAARGWRVIPVHGYDVTRGCTCGRAICEHPGKHPVMSGSFVKYATTDPTIVQQWWGKWPQMNVGVVCGPESGLWVLDVDGSAGALELDHFEEHRRDGALGTLRVRTGSGGLHLYFRWDESQRLKTKIAARFGVDVKANGFVVAPPSVHASGRRYEWLDDYRPLTVAPDDLVRWVKEPRNDGSGGPVGDGEAEWPSVEEMMRDGLPEGRRDDGLFHAALVLLKSGMSRVDAERVVDVIAGRCVPPFPYDQARAKVDAAEAFLRAAAGRQEGAVDPLLSSWAAGVTESGTLEDGELWGGFGDLTDAGNAERLRSTWANARPLVGGGWLVWDDLWRYSRRPLHAIARHLTDVISRECEVVGFERQEALLKWRVSSRGTARVKACAESAESMGDWVVEADDLDADLRALNTLNGLLQLLPEEGEGEW